ncbi:MAG: hypothetical protein EA397_00350 [Deltaproteobacteria bacterium]|nr:MAG: hypothetical protein EA397_00350 [Deltaproteobacteria bacterium]
MRRLSTLLLMACASPEPAPIEADLQEAMARSVERSVLVELELSAQDPRDDEAWTAAIRQAQDAAIQCIAPDPSRVLHRYVRVPMLHLKLDAQGVRRASSCPTVARIGDDGESFAQVDHMLPLIQAPAAWDALGTLGEGVAIGVVDSGLYDDQEALQTRAIWGWDHADQNGDIHDCSGHGSNVAGIAAAVAPGADLIIHKVMNESHNDCRSAFHSRTNRALDDLLAQRRAHRLAVVNLSLGSGARRDTYCDDEIVGYTRAIATLRSVGVPVVVSAGNQGDPTGSTYPSCLSTTFAIANSVTRPIEDLDTDDIWRNSNTGPLIDLAAPGTEIEAGGSQRTGTSMSAPAVAGAVAVIASLDRSLSPEEVLDRLRRTPHEVIDARGETTWRIPRLDLAEALDGLRPLAELLLRDDGSGSTVGDGDGIAENGETVEVGFRLDQPSPWSDVRARLSCDDSGSEVLRDVIRLGGVSGTLDTSVLNTGFLVAIDAACDAREVSCDLTIFDDLGRERHARLILPIACEDDFDNDGFPASVDCDDTDPHRYPGAPERCNGLDDNCDGVIDSGLHEPWVADLDDDGHGAGETVMDCKPPAQGWYPLAERPDDDCDDTDGLIRPGIDERCNGLDDNCNGIIDEDAGPWWWRDADGDGYGVGEPIQACEQPEGYAARPGDCDDTDPRVYPGGPEGDCATGVRHGRRACATVGASATLLWPVLLLLSRRRR